MFYEEKKIDGVLYCRTTPDGEWRIVTDKERIERAEAIINKFDEILCDQFNRITPVVEKLQRMAAGKLPLPTAEQCREFAMRISVPTSEWRKDTP